MPLCPLSAADVSAVLAPFERALALPATAYLEDAVFAFERAAIFDRTWLCVGREDDVTHPGEWLHAPLGTMAGPGLVVVRGADLKLRAFHNVCRHRAATLVSGDCGRVHDLRCPYHGWTYDLGGGLRAAPHAPGDFDRGAHGLLGARVDVWQGFVFATLDASAPPLAEALAPVPAWLRETSLAHARRAHRVTYEAAANWKLLCENFQESHHFTRIHPALERLTPNDDASSVPSSGPWLGGVMRFADGVETVSASGTRNGRPLLAAASYTQQVSDALLFPALFTSLQPDYLLTYRLQPLSPGRTRVVAEIFVHASAFGPHGPSFDLTDLTSFWDVINRQDRAICESQQTGLSSPGFRPSRYTVVEDGVHGFDRMVARAYQTGDAER
jgi:Rieske 2Fe-2S family protein